MIVVDSAALVDALTGVDGSDQLRAELRPEELHAPAPLDYEVVSALRGLVRGGKLDPARAEDVVADFGDLRLRRWPAADPLRRRAFQLRDVISAYDAAYVALAEALDCTLVTRDAKLASATGHGARVVVR